MRRVFYLVQKEFRQIRREKAYIAIIFLMPFVQLVILGYAITTDVRNVGVVVVDQDHSRYSRAILASLETGETFQLLGTVPTERAARRLLDRGKAVVAVIVPHGFGQNLLRGEQPALQLLLDGVDGNSSGVALGYLQGLLAGLQLEWVREVPELARQIQSIHLIVPEPRLWYNENLVSVNHIVPGILAVLLTMITLFLTAMNIVREREIGTMEQLQVTPIRGWELILGKVLPFVLLGFLLLNVGILAVQLIFAIPMQGSLLLLYLMSLLFMLSTLGLGILISTLAHTQQQAMFIAWFFSIFTILLSGFFIPIENMPDVIQYLTYSNPLRYFMTVIRAIYQKGSELPVLLDEVAGMALIAGITISTAVIRLRKRNV
ncbi:MAG: ABC transporter permease [Candidatus Delongbacteria bacterium]|nr:ABC transporter permease [Candidatus Delongbacteria bacterium]